MQDIAHIIARELGVTADQVEAVIALIDEGATIPFIARYRKEATGGLDDVALRTLEERLDYLRRLRSRKDEVLAIISAQGKLTDELREQIEAADMMQRVEDLYKPFRKKRATRASKARDAGLQPLADLIMHQDDRADSALGAAEEFINAEGGFATAEAALQGACDIVAETIADDPEHTAALRSFTRSTAMICSEAIDEEVSASTGGASDSHADPYADFAEAARRIPNHRILAINRGEKEGRLRVRVRTDADEAIALLGGRIVRRRGPFAEALDAAIADSYKRLSAPSLERELRAELSIRAEDDAVRVFARNTESLLMQRPVRGARVVALDPGYRTGCKVAVLDEFGKLLEHTVVYPTPPRNDVAGAKRTLAALVRRHHANTVVIGNGTGSRETEEMVSQLIAESPTELRYTIVNEAGASVYSASELASQEYPNLDVTVRGALSLGHRLQDPLAELVKIPPQSIGVGQYQHDLDQAELSYSLGNVVEDVVNRVGVDVNTASTSLLGYVSGITPTVARNIVAYREENGPFTDRAQLKKVSKLGPKAYLNAAGFLRIADGKNPLDATSVHPESYAVANEVLKRAGVKADELKRGGIPDIERRVGSIGEIAGELGCGILTLIDIIDELKKPGRDPRDDAPEVVFSRSALSIDDLEAGMKLKGTVRNVVDFGTFVDIGVHQDGLVHISKMANRFVKHPSDVVRVGDTVDVWVEKVDRDRKKISLSMIEPR